MSPQITFVGDCASKDVNNFSEIELPQQIRETISKSDIFVFNLEGPLVPPERSPQGPYQRMMAPFLLSIIGKKQPVVTSKPNFVSNLKLSNMNIACLANNHILDDKQRGINTTIEKLRAEGIEYIGGGRNSVEASKPLHTTIDGTRLCFVNYNLIGWRKFGRFIDVFGAEKERGGANSGSNENIRHEIRELANNVDYIFGIFHIDREMSEQLNPKWGEFLESLDLDLAITHHPHRRQVITRDKIHSCGDFIFKHSDPNIENNGALVSYDTNTDSTSTKEFEITNGVPEIR